MAQSTALLSSQFIIVLFLIYFPYYQFVIIYCYCSNTVTTFRGVGHQRHLFIRSFVLCNNS